MAALRTAAVRASAIRRPARARTAATAPPATRGTTPWPRGSGLSSRGALDPLWPVRRPRRRSRHLPNGETRRPRGRAAPGRAGRGASAGCAPGRAGPPHRKLPRDQGPHAHRPGPHDEAAHGQARLPLAGDRPHDAEVALQAARLGPRRHDAALDAVADRDRRAAELHAAAHERVLALAVQHHVGAEAPPVPRAEAGRRDERHPERGVVVERPGRAVEGLPPGALALEVHDVLVGELHAGSAARSATRRPSHADSAASSAATEPSGSVISTPPPPQQTRRGEQKLRRAPGGEAEAGPEIVDRPPAIALESGLRQRDRVEPLALQRLDREPPQLGDAHGLDASAREGERARVWKPRGDGPSRPEEPLRDPPGQGHRLRQPEGRRGEDHHHAEPRGGLRRGGSSRACVDMDPQGNLTMSQGINPDGARAVDVRRPGPRPAHARGHPPREVDVACASIDLAGAEIAMSTKIGRERSLEKALRPLKEDYDFICIDTPPSLGLLTINALTAADKVIVPVQCEYLSMRGLIQLQNTLAMIRENLNPDVDIAGILPTMVDTRTLHAKEAIEILEENFGDQLFGARIRKTIRFAEAPVKGMSVLKYDPNGTAADAYRQLAKEVLSK